MQPPGLALYVHFATIPLSSERCRLDLHSYFHKIWFHRELSIAREISELLRAIASIVSPLSKISRKSIGLLHFAANLSVVVVFLSLFSVNSAINPFFFLSLSAFIDREVRRTKAARERERDSRERQRAKKNLREIKKGENIL
jgi:hypothetical protein